MVCSVSKMCFLLIQKFKIEKQTEMFLAIQYTINTMVEKGQADQNMHFPSEIVNGYNIKHSVVICVYMYVCVCIHSAIKYIYIYS